MKPLAVLALAVQNGRSAVLPDRRTTQQIGQKLAV